MIGVVVAGGLVGDTFRRDQASVHAFHLAIALCAGLVAVGGVLAGVGIVNPARRVAAEECAGGQLVGAPKPAAGCPDPEPAPAPG